MGQPLVEFILCVVEIRAARGGAEAGNPSPAPVRNQKTFSYLSAG